MPSTVFRIENGVFGLSLVDTAEIGYSEDWQAPGGATVETVTIADYAAPDGGDFTCQVTSGALTASPNTTTDTTPATFCGPEETTTSVGVTSYTLDATILQDPQIAAGVSAYLFEHDTKEAYFLLGFNGTNPPRAIGRCRIVAGALGGDARVTLTATLSLPVTRKPDAIFGTSVTVTRVVTGSGTAGAAAEDEEVLEESELETASA